MNGKSWIIFLLLLFAAVDARSQTDAKHAKPVKPLTFVYVHGFIENEKVPSFQQALDKFISKWSLSANTQTYRWEQKRIKPTMIVAQWNQSKTAVMNKVPDFTETIIKTFEAEERPYVLVGYSLGTRLIAGALSDYDQPLKSLQGVYFLGSALPHDYDFGKIDLPNQMKIRSYYSEKFDSVLKFSFYHAEGIRAGGEVGFPDSLVENYRTACNHISFKTPIQRDYSSLAPAIVWQTYAQQNLLISTSKEVKKGKVTMPAGSGELHWNEILKSGDILVEKNTNAEIYRAIRISDKHRKTIGWSRNMHDLMIKVGLFTPDVDTPEPNL